MRFHRFLRPECIRLSMRCDELPDPPEEMKPERRVWYYKDAILEELSEVLADSGEIASAKRIYKDLRFSEKQGSTGIGEGIAIPHVRTLRARKFVMGFVRSDRGLPYGSMDDEPVQFFFPMVAPPYDDRLYLRVYQDLARALSDPLCRETLRGAESPDDVIWGLQSFIST